MTLATWDVTSYLVALAFGIVGVAWLMTVHLWWRRYRDTP